MNKKILILTLFCMIFLVGIISNVSAVDFDNYLKYENNDLTVKIKDSYFYIDQILNWGEELGTIELTSHKSTEEVKKVAVGLNEVMRMEIDHIGDYKKIIKQEVEIIDLKTGEEVERLHYWEKAIYGENYIPVYETKCDDITHLNNSVERICSDIKVGEELEILSWERIDEGELPKGESTIRLIVDIKHGDYMDGIPTFYGKKIKKWVAWTNPVLENHDDSFGNGGAGTDIYGVGIRPNVDKVLINVTKNETAVATTLHLYIRNGASFSVIGNFTFAGDTATVEELLTADTDYLLGVDSNGASYNSAFGETVRGINFNTSGTNMYWFDAPLPATPSSRVWNIQYLYLGDPVIPLLTPTIVFPVDATYFTNDLNLNYTFINVSNTDSCFNSIDEGETNSSRVDCGVNFTSLTATEGVNNWFVCGNVTTGATGCTNQTFTVNTTPSILFVAPTPIDFRNQSYDSLPVNVTITETFYKNITFNLWNSSEDHINSEFFIDSTRFFNWTGLGDDTYTYNVTVWTTTNQTNITTTRTLTIDTNSPLVNITFPFNQSTITDDFAISDNTTVVLNWTVSDPLLDSCWYFNSTDNVTVNCVAESTNFSIDYGNYLFEFYANDSFGNLNSTSTNVTYDFGFSFNSIKFNITTYETTSENFELNISNPNQNVVTASLIYDGTSQGGSTNIGNITDMLFTDTVIVPALAGATSENNTIFWNVTIDSITSSISNSSDMNQTAEPIFLEQCNASNNIRYINFTFQNETLAQEDVNATFNSAWTYFLSSQSTNKTLTFLNATENARYSFCFTPPQRQIGVIMSADYSNSESQQRTFTFNGLLTNITTTKTLLLLPTGLGLFSPFATVDLNGEVVAAVAATISRVIGGVLTTTAQGTTDDSGFITFFLNPDFTYSAIFSKASFPDNTFSFVPTADLRQVVMGGGVTGIGNGTTISSNTTILITPINGSLNNQTDYNFSLTVTSTENINFISINITNSSGFQLLFDSNAGVGTIGGVLNTGLNTTFIGRFIIETATESTSLTRRWIIGTIFVGDYSIFRQLTLFNEYGFDEFLKFMFILLVIIGIMGFMSARNIEGETKIMTVMALIWAFSLVGWLDTGFVSSSSNSAIQGLSQFSSQYGLAILSTVLGSYFILRRTLLFGGGI